MARGRRIHLNFGQRSILPKDGQPAVEILIVFLFGHVPKVVNHEVRREIGVAAGSIALRSAAQVKTGLGEELIFQVKAGLVDFLILVSEEPAATPISRRTSWFTTFGTCPKRKTIRIST